MLYKDQQESEKDAAKMIKIKELFLFLYNMEKSFVESRPNLWHWFQNKISDKPSFYYLLQEYDIDPANVKTHELYLADLKIIMGRHGINCLLCELHEFPGGQCLLIESMKGRDVYRLKDDGQIQLLKYTFIRGPYEWRPIYSNIILI